METITFEGLQHMLGKITPSMQSNTNMNIYLNDDFIQRMSVFPFTELYDAFDIDNNRNIVDTIFNLLSQGTVGDLVIEKGTRGGRQALFCKLNIDPRGGKWGFSLRSKEVLERSNIYQRFKDFIQLFIEETIFKHVDTDMSNCIYFTFELVPKEAIIFID